MAMRHRIPHSLGAAMGRKVTTCALESYRDNFREYQPQGRWVSEQRAEVSFTVAGKRLTGAVEVFADAVELELEVPFLFRPFRKAAIRIIEGEIRQWIARAEAGELDDQSA